MLTTDFETWKNILPKIEKIINQFNKTFAKYDGELREISAYSSDDEEVQFIIPDLRFYPFDNRNTCKIECDENNKSSYSISLPNHIYTDEEYDNVLKGMEDIAMCKSWYDMMVEAIIKLF